jgi:hypothetical protein
MSSQFAPGSTVVFRAYAVDTKTHKLVTKKKAKLFYVKIPDQKKLKLKYKRKADVASGRFAWIGKWKVPSDYPTGVVAFKVLVKTKSKRSGSFSQAPVEAAQLTISTSPQLPFGNGPNTRTNQGSSKVDVALYADTVNGSRPAGAEPRPLGCTQTNVFKRGEQLVLRTWGFEMRSGDVLSMDNVADAHFSVAGVPDIVLNWGGHGATGAKVWFWTNQWQIPTDYPLGDATIHIQFKTLGGKVGKLDYPVTIIP